MDLKWAGFVLGAGALACGAIGAALAGPASAHGIYGRIFAARAVVAEMRPATDGVGETMSAAGPTRVVAAAEDASAQR